MKTLATIEHCPVIEHDDLSLTFLAHGRIDTDGTGPSHGDRWHQRDTSLHYAGKALNSDTDHYFVLPKAVAKAARGVVLGCRVEALNTLNGKTDVGVCGDLGPDGRLGEFSEAVAAALGVNGNPNTGGEDRPVIQYKFFPGLACYAHGKSYSLRSLASLAS